MDYIKDVFLGQIHADNSKALNIASHLLDSWKSISDVEVLRDYQVGQAMGHVSFSLEGMIQIRQHIFLIGDMYID